ncbi:hypothetical protein SAMN00768000_0220 [Sulfobacillus thermosulfidooxidans DSM 9293]|uniref:Uncharacterized protein n=1 Tax=Sulfobacillus thermosulfidooxidans (strain DSM 9293 / VKM B-1269 / AT-1) TaxID=929705 RepID=A0A1W1W6T6_SULTA|nr:hypothetical protein [Sulfobacillus thermosulfidooxidans]SMC02011.1 hypothetical protein SAMN00768000_0220 [Sulfobacillus thermosulfidooxidans DSM 9293]
MKPIKQSLACQEFLEQLYWALWNRSEGGLVTSQPRVGPGSHHPELSREQLRHQHPDWNLTDLADWEWRIEGSPNHWWLRIIDERLLGRDHPYYLVPYDNPLFVALCEEFYDDVHPEPDKRMEYCVGTLFINMEEKLLGQTEALRAYETGATSDNPPWVYTTEPA